MKKDSILWIITVGTIFAIFIFYKEIAIWFTLILLIIAIASYVYSLTFKKKLIRAMQKYQRIIDIDIAKELNQSIEKIRKKLSKVYKHQKKSAGLLVFLNNRYIFYNAESINKLKLLYNKNIREKEIFEISKTTIGLRTRAEVKAIKDQLMNHKNNETNQKLITIKDKIRK